VVYIGREEYGYLGREEYGYLGREELCFVYRCSLLGVRILKGAVWVPSGT
jgi:hypothetical protein